jgi:hypothetical protein
VPIGRRLAGPLPRSDAETRRRRPFAYNSGMSEHGFAAENNDAFSEDGIDLTLIRWMLSLSPAERLQVLQSNIRSLETIRGAANRR